MTDETGLNDLAVLDSETGDNSIRPKANRLIKRMTFLTSDSPIDFRPSAKLHVEQLKSERENFQQLLPTELGQQ